MKLLVVIVSLSLFSAINCDLDWWKTANVYQIYPRSFKDSNGDGIGDLNGITQMLPYLKDLGINAFWMSPIFKSPMADFGYDISDFKDIHYEYGNMTDFERLLKTAHDLNLKVVLDFVPNHSSDENEWFIKSAAGDETYKDFYTWYPGKDDPANPGTKLPPSNWLSEFRGSAWKFHEGRGEYYLHQFAAKQPDLNYRNQKVVDTMKDVLRFWLDKGVDGFRVDTVPHLFEVAPTDGQFPDEVRSGLTDDPDNYAYLYHNLTKNLPETVEMVYQWRDVLEEYTKKDGNTRILLTEAYTDIDILMQYYGNGVKNGSHVPFNFYMIMNLKNHSNAIDFDENIKLWLKKLPNKSVPNWVMGNHDQRRIGSRFGIHRIDLINMILNTLPGVSITYNGEEIGMTDVFLTWDQTVDPAACNSNPQIYDQFSRDPARTPFQWDSSTSAGFSTSPSTWLPVSSLYQQVNVKVQKNAPRSHLKVYRQLLRLRHTETLQKGTVETRTHGQNVLSITRRLSGRDTYITIANIGGQRESIDIREIFSGRLIFHIIAVNSRRREGDPVRGPNIDLEPHEAFILRSVA
ncbi:maltase A3-like [Lutzomyia longipalpis]|uniref:maltase A3-like n=1 Tax=Lutzomyia longipalpis TaxID=7200 RepID=UPI00248459C1|nr:maltase A3-like [Lutzomyia longipalpis]